MNLNQAEEKIINHIQRKRDEEEAKIRVDELELEQLMNEIRKLEPRITDIIIIGNMCREHGIPLRQYGTYRKCTYKDGSYETDGIYHQLGFYPINKPYYKLGPNDKYKYIGIEMGGALGNRDFITNGEIIADTDNDNYDTSIKYKPSIRHCKRFLKDFEEFEKAFYEFINNL